METIFGSGGKFSSLMLDFILRREIGHYVLEYYIPSLLLVAMSWVGFWLDPNAVPGRCVIRIIYISKHESGKMKVLKNNWVGLQVSFLLLSEANHNYRTTLGTATWLTLITLTRNTGSDNLPKVSVKRGLTETWED